MILCGRNESTPAIHVACDLSGSSGGNPPAEAACDVGEAARRTASRPGWARPSYANTGLRAQALATLATATRDDRTTRASPHAGAKSVALLAATIVGLKCTLHGIEPCDSSVEVVSRGLEAGTPRERTTAPRSDGRPEISMEETSSLLDSHRTLDPTEPHRQGQGGSSPHFRSVWPLALRGRSA